MKPEHNQSCGLPFTDTKKNSPRLFQSKKVPQNTPGSRPTLQAAIKLWGKTPDHQLTRKTRLRTLPHAPNKRGRDLSLVIPLRKDGASLGEAGD